MPRVRACSIPSDALLRRYAGADGYVDCYTAMLPHAASLEQFVTAFYTTWLFKLERWILTWSVSKPSTDRDAVQVASGAIESFAAWRVEARASDQLLMCDFLGNTRSWFMVASEPDCGTRLYFGSAVVPRVQTSSGRRLGWQFRLLLGFHRRYSVALLGAAWSRLRRTGSDFGLM